MAFIPMTTLQRRQLVDDAMDAYVDWREECAAVSAAYRGWAAAEASHAVLAFGVYAAALDREERASQVYAGLIRRASDLLTTGDEAESDLVGSTQLAGPSPDMTA